VSAPTRIRRSRAKGSRLPENTVCVDRSTKWGNPFVVGEHGTGPNALLTIVGCSPAMHA
jgi:hypothetical protein